MHAQLLKEIFVRMEGNNINKLVKYCWKRYADHVTWSNNIDLFTEYYQLQTAFFVYSSDSNDKRTLASFKRDKEGKENKSTWNDES
jgi:hypothetical protein